MHSPQIRGADLAQWELGMVIPWHGHTRLWRRISCRQVFPHLRQSRFAGGPSPAPSNFGAADPCFRDPCGRRCRGSYVPELRPVIVCGPLGSLEGNPSAHNRRSARSGKCSGNTWPARRQFLPVGGEPSSCSKWACIVRLELVVIIFQCGPCNICPA